MNADMIARTDSINSILASRGALFRVKGSMRNNTLELISNVLDECPAIPVNISFWSPRDDEIADELEEIFFAKAAAFHLVDYLEKDRIRARILPKALSAEHISEVKRKGLAFCIKLDLIFTFYIPIAESRSTNQTVSICVTQNLLSRAGIDLTEAIACASRNIEAEAECRPITAVLNEYRMGPDPDEENPLWVLTTHNRRYGAGAVLSEHLLEKVAEKLNTKNLIILPSSVEEVLVLQDGKFDPRDMLSIVETINETEVRPEDRLTDNVYFFRHGELQALV